MRCVGSLKSSMVDVLELAELYIIAGECCKLMNGSIIVMQGMIILHSAKAD